MVPTWFLSPRRPAELLPVLLGNGLLAVLFALPCMDAVEVFGLPGPLSRALATGLAAVPCGLFGLAFLAGLALCLRPERGDSSVQAPVVPRRPQMRRLSPEGLAAPAASATADMRTPRKMANFRALTH